MAEQLTNLFTLPDFAMPRFGVGAFLDIALITFATYKILSWVRRTRAWGIFRGIFALALVYILSMLFGMYTTSWLISQITPVAAIAVVVLFQPELRKALERLGKAGRRLPFISNIEEERAVNSAQMIEEIIIAATKLSQTKTGGLVVIEQTTPLNDLESTGIALDAIVTSQLLLSIFETTSPMHDGAVIVRENRAKASNCILPLTSEHLSSELGTRHRAAVGVSETSDAYVLVVSEETGGISIAKDGKLNRNLSENEIRKILLAHLKPAKPRIRKSRKKKN